MNAGLSHLEKRVEQVIEGAFARLFAGRLHPHEVAVQLSRAMEDHLRPRGPSEWIAPDRFRVRLHPADADALLAAEPQLADQLARALSPLAREAGLTLLRPPTVELIGDVAVLPRGVIVESDHTEIVSDTVGITPVARIAPPPPAPRNAFLIVDGGRHFALDRPVVSIGRRLDNQIILDHPKISRTHAQLRLRHGRYVLYDLGSSGGTKVNGEPVKERVLEAGDVISLPGMSLIYGEEERDAVELEEPTKPIPASGRVR